MTYDNLINDTDLSKVELPRSYSGVIINTVTTPYQDVFVAMERLDAESVDDLTPIPQRVGPVTWSPRGADYPNRGDLALVAFADDGEPWLVEWQPADPSTVALESDIAGLEHTANKGSANGYAPLDSGLLVPVANLPKLNAIGAPVADVSFNNHKGTNALDPTAAQDMATKNYVDTHTARAAKVTHNVNQTFASGGATNVVAFNTLTRDDASAWVSGSNSRLTAQIAGWYQIHASAFMSNGTTPGWRQLCLRKNGTAYIQTTEQANSSAAQDTEQEVSCLDYLNAGDYVEVVLFFGGAATTVQTLANARSPQFSIARI